MRYATLAALLSFVAAAALAQEQPVPLKPGDGMDTTAAFCAVCHSVDYIRMNSVFLTPDGWKAEITKMRTAFGAPIDDETADAIQRYLAAQYSVAPHS